MLKLLLTVPVPRDPALPLPLPEPVLQVLIVVLFLAHIVFVNLMVGGSLLSVFCEARGRKDSRWDALARRIAETVTVNKSLAVVLGVGPLLCINLLYATHFYSANALTGGAWLGVLVLIGAAFLLSYAHRYTWERWQGSLKPAHQALGAAAALLFLLIPFVFLVNTNLMLYPERWSEVKGFLSALRVGNVFPRYLHFLAASLALTGLFLAGWLGRAGSEEGAGFGRLELRRGFYRLAFWISAGQFVFGPMVLFTLPSAGWSPPMLAAVLFGALLAVVALGFLWIEITAPEEELGRFLPVIIALFLMVVVFMGVGRHLFRESKLAGHKRLVRERTLMARALEASYAPAAPARDGGDAAQRGAELFAYCAACHNSENALAGPKVQEIARLYAGDPGGFAEWVRNPGHKRANYVRMPAFTFLSDEDLAALHEYVTELSDKRQATSDTRPD